MTELEEVGNLSVDAENAVNENQKIHQQIEGLKDVLKANEEIILSEYPEDTGAYSRVMSDGRKVVVSRNETWAWDTEALDRLFASSSLPDFVTKKLSIPKAKFNRLTAKEQAEYLHALTRKPGAPKITIDGA